MSIGFTRPPKGTIPPKKKKKGIPVHRKLLLGFLMEAMAGKREREKLKAVLQSISQPLLITPT